MTTIYFAGGEDTSFTLLNFSVFTGGTQYRSAYARCAVGNISNAGTAGYPPANYAQTPVFTAASVLWIHGQFWNNNSNSNTNNSILMNVMDSGGVGRILVRATGTAGQLKISKRNAAGTITDLVTSAAGAMPSSTNGIPIAVDLFINYAVSGQATLYFNGTNVADTGAGIDVTTDAATQLAQVQFSGISAGNQPYWSECIIQDTSTLGAALWTLAPAAAGNTQSWTPNTVANVNKTTINDATFVSTTSNNALSEWTTNVTPPPGTWVVEALVQEARVSVGITGPQHFEWLVRTADGSDHVQGSVAPTTSFANYGVGNGSQWATNPHTGSAWVISDFVAGFNIGIESLA